MNGRKIWLGVAALALAAVVSYALLHRQSAPKTADAAQARAVPVKVAIAARGDLDVTLKIIGRVEAAATVTVRSRVAGQLQSLEFEPGERVTRGKVLARLDQSLLAAQLEQAQGVLARDTAQLAKAKADIARYTDVVAKGYLSKTEFDQYTANLGIAQANIKADRAGVELARTQLNYTVVVAPFDGVVGAPLVYPGAQIVADSTDLVVINQTHPVNVGFALPEATLGAVKRSMAERAIDVQLRIPGDDADALNGILGFVDNAVDESTGTILLKARYDNADDRLTPGQFVNVTLPITRLAAAVTIPVIALQNAPTGPFVFVVGADQSVEQRNVVPGVTVDQQQVIDSGLKEGEKVVIEGQLLLVPKAKVQVVGDSAAIAPQP